MMPRRRRTPLPEESNKAWYDRPVSPGFVYDRPFGTGDANFHLFLFLSPVKVSDEDGRHQTNGITCVIYPPRSPQYFEAATSRGAARCDHAAIRPTFAPLIKKLDIPLSKALLLGSAHELRPLFMTMWQEESACLPHCERLLQATSQILLIRLAREISRYMRRGNPKFRQDVLAAVGKVCADIERDPAREWSVGELAAASGCSRSRFWNQFREITGVSPQNYIIAARIRAVCVLLTNTKLNVSEIAQKTGFSSAYYLSRLFHKRMGCPPSKYAEQFRIKEANR